MSSRARQGFTMIEVLAAVLLTTIVVVAATTMYLNVSRQTEAALAHTREGRHAVAILDRIARDLEGALVVIEGGSGEEGEDAAGGGWLFEAQQVVSDVGADRLRFTVQNRVAQQQRGPSSDLALVTYAMTGSESGEGYELRRWTSEASGPVDPEELPQGPGALLADGLQRFGVRLQDENGLWTEAWGAPGGGASLPFQAEIIVALLDPEDPDGELGGEVEEWRRRVILPVRPIDLAQATADAGGPGNAGGEDDEDGEPGEDGEEGDGEESGDAATGQTVAQCLERYRGQIVALLGEDFVADILASDGDKPASTYASLYEPLGIRCE